MYSLSGRAGMAKYMHTLYLLKPYYDKSLDELWAKRLRLNCIYDRIVILHIMFNMIVTISTPPMQRKIIGESCQFSWKVTENYTAYAATFLSSHTALGPNTNLSSSNSVITLLIRNIQQSDAGYYSLTINTGLSTEVHSVVMLFVYGQ